MGIFKSVTKILKKAAPVIGGTIGFAIGGPMGSAALGSALGAGIGSLVGGADTDDALKAALLGGIGGYAASGGNFFTPTAGNAGVTGSAANITGSEIVDPKTISAIKSSSDPGILSKIGAFAKENPFTTAGIAGLGLTALGGLEEEEKDTTKRRPFPKGDTRLGFGRIGDTFYDLDNEEERNKYFEDLRKRKEEDDEVVVSKAMGGMQVNPALQGFGSEISNSIGEPVREKLKEVPGFLNEVETMAEQRFGIELENQDSSFNSLQDFFDQYRDGLGFEKTDMEQREPMFENQLQREPMIERNFYNRFQSGIAAQPFGSFGGGGSRLAGMGAIGSLFMNNGGEVEGPGTGTSDSVPARLSDGEFVLTAKAVRGAGGGDRDLGAARMYDMMSELERVA